MGAHGDIGRSCVIGCTGRCSEPSTNLPDELIEPYAVPASPAAAGLFSNAAAADKNASARHRRRFRGRRAAVTPRSHKLAGGRRSVGIGGFSENPHIGGNRSKDP